MLLMGWLVAMGRGGCLAAGGVTHWRGGGSQESMGRWQGSPGPYTGGLNTMFPQTEFSVSSTLQCTGL